MRGSLVQGSMRCDHLHIAVGHGARKSFSQSETSGVTIERETAVWLVDEARKLTWPIKYRIQYKVGVLLSLKANHESVSK